MARIKRSGIYCIENILDGKKYIGQSTDITGRMNQHLRNLRSGKNTCLLLQRAYNKYGKDNLIHYVIIYCEEWELDRLEIECIKIFHSHVSDGGYNISWGGDAPMRGIKGKDNPNYGRHASEETRALISKNHADMSGEKSPNLWDTSFQRSQRENR